MNCNTKSSIINQTIAILTVGRRVGGGLGGVGGRGVGGRGVGGLGVGGRGVGLKLCKERCCVKNSISSVSITVFFLLSRRCLRFSRREVRSV